MGASGDGSQGCICKTSLSCQRSAAGEEGNLGQARLQGCIRLSFGTGQPRQVPGNSLGSCSGWEQKGTGLLFYSQPHPSFALLKKNWSDVGAGSSCLLSRKARNFPRGTHSGWRRAVTQGLFPSPILQHQETALGVMLEMGNQQVAPWAGGYPCAGVQLGTGRPLGELPFSSTPQCGTGTSRCSPCPSRSHHSPNVWLSALSSLAGLMQSLGHWGAGCPLRKYPTKGHLPDMGTGWPGAPFPYWEHPQGVRSWWPSSRWLRDCCVLLPPLSQLSAQV